MKGTSALAAALLAGCATTSAATSPTPPPAASTPTPAPTAAAETPAPGRAVCTGKGGGVRDSLPGVHVRFNENEAWDRAIIISPQGATRVNSEIDAKCPQWKDRIIVPRVTRASGKTLIAIVDNAALGGPPKDSWGYQVLMQSNEGFPGKADLLTRRVNEFEGQHRFGGGTDYDNAPFVMDILVPPNGDPVKKQH